MQVAQIIIYVCLGVFVTCIFWAYTAISYRQSLLHSALYEHCETLADGREYYLIPADDYLNLKQDESDLANIIRMREIRSQEESRIFKDKENRTSTVVYLPSGKIYHDNESETDSNF